jgi:hypothetical protein
MAVAHEDNQEGSPEHPYWYAKVLGIYHINVRVAGEMETHKMEFLWVHWFGRDPDHEGGFKTRHLHRIGLLDTDDPTSYGFLNPSDVLRGMHLIPAFLTGRLPSSDLEVDKDDMDWEFYHVSM